MREDSLKPAECLAYAVELHDEVMRGVNHDSYTSAGTSLQPQLNHLRNVERKVIVAKGMP